MTKRFYCRLCWQEFDDVRDHDAASAFVNERLNGHCKGEIHLAEGRKPVVKYQKPEGIPLLESVDGITL